MKQENVGTHTLSMDSFTGPPNMTKKSGSFSRKVSAREVCRRRTHLLAALPYLILHGGNLGLIWVGWSPFAVFAAIALYLLRMFAVTAFYHRYFSHRSFRTSRPVQFAFAIIASTAMQRGALWWAATHRHHHQHSDEEKDFHSPGRQGFLWSHIGWLACPESLPTDYSRIPDLAKFPELVFLNRHEFIVPILYGLAMLGLGTWLEHFAPALGTNGPQMLVWGLFVSTTVLLHGTLTINSLAHVFGSRRFETKDDSRNSLFLALITLGEGWHNNHHRYPHSARQGFYWWEIDISYAILRILSWTGLIWDLRAVPAHIYEEASSNRR